MVNYKERLKNIKAFVFDYDGVLTNGTVILQEDGEPLRAANVRDGYALQLAAKNGYHIAVISGGRSKSIINRFRVLQINDVYLGAGNKVQVFQEFMKVKGLKPEDVLYMGDDIPDFQAMKLAGIAACPADATEEIRSISHYISHQKGGEGCVRDIIEQVLKIQGKWMNHDAFSW